MYIIYMPPKYAYKKRKPYRKPNKKRAYRRKTAPALSLVQKKQVKALIHRQIENKVVCYGGSMDVYPISSATYFSANSNWYQFTLPIGNGTTGATRIGEKLLIRKVMLRGVLSLESDVTGSYAVPGQYNVKMLIGHRKDAPASVPTSTTFLDVFKAGSTVVPPDATLFTLIRPINKDSWVVEKQRTFKVGMASYFQNSGGQTYGYTLSTGVNNNDYKVTHLFNMDVTKCFSKKNTYDIGSSANKSCTPILMMCATDLYGTTTSYSTNPPLRFSWELDVHFEDA